jgi:hypothetical protein
MKVLTQSKQRAVRCWQRSLRLRTPDDETKGLWATKRAYQAHSRDLVRTGQSSQVDMLLFSKAVVRATTFRRRTDEF